MPRKCFSNELWFYFGFFCLRRQVPFFWANESSQVPPTLHFSWMNFRGTLPACSADQLMLSKLGSGSIRVLKLHLEDAQMGDSSQNSQGKDVGTWVLGSWASGFEFAIGMWQ